MSHNSSRDFGGSNIFGSVSNTNDSSQWNNNNNNNDNDDNNSNNLSNFQPQVRGLNSSEYYDRSLIPTTVKKILSEPEPAEDEPFRIDGKPVHQVAIIGYLRSIKHHSTHTIFEIDDQCSSKTGNRGWMICKLWSSDNDDLKQCQEEQLMVNDMVRIIGKIGTWNNLRSINIHYIGKVLDKNQVFAHYIEAIFAHELNTLIVNEHIPSYKQQLDEYMTASQTEHDTEKQRYNQYKAQQQQQQQQQQSMGNNYGGNRGRNSNNWNNGNDGNYGGNYNRFASNNNSNNNNNNNNNNNDEHGLNQLQRNVLAWLRSKQNDGLGFSRDEIKRGVNCYRQQPIDEAIQELFKRGLIQDTIEDNFAAVI